MTKEELVKEAEKYAIKSYGNDDWTQVHIEDMEIDYIRKCIAQSYLVGAVPREKRIKDLEKENAEAKNLIEELASSLSVVGECDEEECELINKAQKFINKPIF